MTSDHLRFSHNFWQTLVELGIDVRQTYMSLGLKILVPNVLQCFSTK